MNGDGLWGFNWTWKFWLWSIVVLLIALLVGLVVLTQWYGGPGVGAGEVHPLRY
jgi:hypothetical protein